MKTVLFDVGYIVPEIDRTGEAAKSHEGKRCPEKGLGLEEMFREEESGEDEEILRPLTRAERSQQAEQGGLRSR